METAGCCLSLPAGLSVAVLLDAIMGDPRWLPHPVQGMGWLALRLERWSRRRFTPARAGLLTTLLVLLATLLFFLLLLLGFFHLSPLLGISTALFFLAQALAGRSLLEHGMKVYRALEQTTSLTLARRRVQMLVGRQCDHLDQAGIIRACIESVAENMSDGFVAPLFWATSGGVAALPLSSPGHALLVAAGTAMFYKAINTLDSTFGYTHGRYIDFGRFAAKLDDMANVVPARLAALALVLVAPLAGGNWRYAWQVWRRDRHHHASPNSGHPEAAMAGALGIGLGGGGVYFGTFVRKAWIGDPGVPLQPDHIRQACLLVAIGSLVVLVCLLLLVAGGCSFWW